MAFLSQTGLSTKGYLENLRRTEADRLDLLSGESPDKTRYKESRHAVATTWLMSFDQLQESCPEAVVLLGFLSQVQPTAIPLTMLPSFGSDLARLNVVMELYAYSFVSIHDDTMLDMHSLVHMAARSWLQRRTVLKRQHMADIFLNISHENCHIWRAYPPHALYILDDGKSVDSLDALGLCVDASYCLLVDDRTNDAVRCLQYCIQWTRSVLPEDCLKRLSSEHMLAIAHLHNGQTARGAALLEHVVKLQLHSPKTTMTDSLRKVCSHRPTVTVERYRRQWLY